MIIGDGHWLKKLWFFFLDKFTTMSITGPSPIQLSNAAMPSGSVLHLVVGEKSWRTLQDKGTFLSLPWIWTPGVGVIKAFIIGNFWLGNFSKTSDCPLWETYGLLVCSSRTYWLYGLLVCSSRALLVTFLCLMKLHATLIPTLSVYKQWHHSLEGSVTHWSSRHCGWQALGNPQSTIIAQKAYSLTELNSACFNKGKCRISGKNIKKGILTVE